MAWDKKYRPKVFADVLGQDGAMQVLKARVLNGSGLDTSYVFAGPSGTGKTTSARILARALICTDRRSDGEPCNACDNCLGILGGTSSIFRELDAASAGTIDNVRALVDDLSYSVLGAAKRIILFDEMHRMSRDSQDVLLKPLEEKKLVGIFCTTEPLKIRPTISSRCETHTIRFPTKEEILGRVASIMGAEGVEFEEEAVLTVIDYCGGHVRDVLNRLEMVSQMGPCTLEAVRAYLDLGAVSKYYDVLLSLGDPSVSVPLVESLCDQVSPEEVLSGLAEAAMNGWRVANKLTANFAQMDRAKAEALHKAYGESLLAIADHFLRVRRSTTLGVVCAVVACRGGVPTQTTAAPVVLQVTAQAPLVAPPTPQVEVPQTQPTTESTPPVNKMLDRASQHPVLPATNPPVSDLTPLERRAIPNEMPRGAAREPKVREVSPSEQVRILAPAQAAAAILAKVRRT